jgi:hypothetical protein
MDQNLAELATNYVAAADGSSDKYWSGGGEHFRFTADGHTVEIAFDEEFGWRIIADGAMVKQADEEDDRRPSAFEEAWLILAKLVRPTETDDEAKDLFWKASRENRVMSTDIETIREWAQMSLGSLTDKRPDWAIRGRKLVLEGIGPDSPDVKVIKRVIDRLEAIVVEITEVEDLLSKTDFAFGNIKALRERPVTMPWEDPLRLN